MKSCPLLKGALASLLISHGATSWARADEPGRFLLVEGWRGTFTQGLTLQGSGILTGSSEICQVDYSYVHRLNASHIVFWTQGAFGTSRYWITDYQQGNAGSFAERHTVDCPLPEPLTHTGTGASMAGVFLLQVDTAANQYTLQFPELIVTLAVNDNPGIETGVSWSPMIVTNLPASGMSLSGSLTVPLAEFTRVMTVPLVIDNVEHLLQSTPLTVTWSLEPILEELEVVVEPQAYDKWIPEGNLAPPFTSRKNWIRVAAKLQKKGGGVPSIRAESFTFEFTTVSKNPGVCMNLPLDNPSDEPDLKFENDLNLPPPGIGNVINDDGTQIEIVGLNPFISFLETEAVISSFDFGAYGELKVSATIPGSKEPIIGHLKDDDSQTNIRIPKTKQGSRIPEAWLNKNGGQAGQLFDDTDQDSFPEGDGHKGDGLSLYEEYRGFSVNRTHIRTKPTKKDLFIRNQMSNKDTHGAIEQFRTASKLEVRKVDKNEISGDAIINFNHDWSHNIDQHGLILEGRQKKKGFSEAVSKSGAVANSTPGSKSQLEIEPTGPGWGLDFSSDPNGDVLQYSQFESRSVAHEIGHGCSIWHHGDCDIDGKAVGLKWLTAPDYSHIEARRVGNAISQTPIVILDPDGSTPLFLTFSVDTNTGISYLNRTHMAVLHGQHSGDTTCIMCYAMADCFRRDMSSRRHLVLRWPAPARTGFCTSHTGTGINASGTAGGPWVGDAYQAGAKSRGNCAAQICVNDLYANDPKHDRDYTCPAW